MSNDPEDPDDLEMDFLDYVAAFESEVPKDLSVVLPKSGVALPPPDELSDSELSAKLWEVINMLSLLGTFLHNTNHLSDRELYTDLWTEILREPMVLMPGNAAFACHIDMVGSGSEEHNNLYMKYYADEKTRRRWQKDWPDDVLPDPEKTPYDRDRLLPQAESRRDGPVM
ncbi:MAG TPA: hypothetical protein VGS07_03815 [Thermoanaerobaculia bacterium]|jgi:hypothetical protein|nr:hypothetical protein [Thermoanaerobaculia bacterium]